MVVADMPFLSYHTGKNDSVEMPEDLCPKGLQGCKT